MPHNEAPTQESRTERAAIALTPTEKRAVRAVAAVRGTDESNLLRSTTVSEVVAEFERLQATSTVS